MPEAPDVSGPAVLEIDRFDDLTVRNAAIRESARYRIRPGTLCRATRVALRHHPGGDLAIVKVWNRARGIGACRAADGKYPRRMR
jgi:hypothetical protein